LINNHPKVHIIEEGDPSKTEKSIESTKSKNSSKSWVFDFPIVEGWPPEKSRNISLYVRPKENTTLISPR